MMLTSYILKPVDFIQRQKSRYLDENKTFFLQIKKLINYTSRASYCKKLFCSGSNLEKYSFYSQLCGLNMCKLNIFRFSQSRNSRLQMFFKIGVFKNFANFTGKQLCWDLFLIKLQVFSCEIFENFKNTFFREHVRWLPLC